MASLQQALFASAGAPPPPPVVTYGGFAAASGSGAGPYTATLNIGTAAANRVVVVAVEGGAASRPTITSMTIGGVSATSISNTSATNGGVCLWYAVVPTGTTANLSYSWSASLAAVSDYGYWYINNVTSTTPFSTTTANAGSGTVTATGLNVPAGGVLIAAVSSTLSSPTIGGTAFAGGTTDWSGFTSSSSYRSGGGHINGHAGITGGTITSTPGGSTNGVLAAGASWS